MRKLLIFIVPSLLLAAYAGWRLDVSRLYAVFQSLTVCLSIMAAAIFVRLNRGMPTLDWKTIAPTNRNKLTAAVVSLARDYLVGLGLAFSTILMIMVLTSMSAVDVKNLPEVVQQCVVAGFVSLALMSVVWMGYVIWRDYDIVQLQKRVIDEAAQNEEIEQNRKLAETKIVEAQSTNLRAERTTIVPWH